MVLKKRGGDAAILKTSKLSMQDGVILTAAVLQAEGRISH
jgi:hypothetical protein